MAQTAIDFDERGYDGGGAGAPLRQREIEENLWRAIRWGLDGEMVDFRNDARVVPTRRLLEEIVGWTAPARAQLGLELELPERNGAQRARGAVAEGRPIEEIYRHAVDETQAHLRAAIGRGRG